MNKNDFKIPIFKRKIFHVLQNKKYIRMNEKFIMYANHKKVFSQMKSPRQSRERCTCVF